MANLPPAQPIEIRPQKGPQETFLSTPADIAVYGGAAGGGKTYGILLEALRHVGVPGFGCVIFRRTKEDIRNEGAIWDNSKDLYSLTGAKSREQQLDWLFPSGASISFDGLQYENTIYDWQGAQICLLGFDELTHFSAKQFFYMLGRNRSTCGIRPYVRATCNPDEDSWVFDLLGPWVNEEHPHFGAQPGELRWFIREEGEIIWVAQGAYPDDEKSITFIPAKVHDNKILLAKDPGYLANLKAQDPDERDRLLHGLWTKKRVKGALWTQQQIDKDRVNPSDVPPLERVVVAVDPGTNSSESSDETGIVVVGKCFNGHFYTLEDSSGHYTPDGWAQEVVRLFNLYRAARVVAEKNQGGDMVRHTIHTVAKIPVHLVHAKKAKEVRAEPVSRMAAAGLDHHVGTHRKLEAQLTRWVPGSGKSPDRLDAKVYGVLDLGIGPMPEIRGEVDPGSPPESFTYQGEIPDTAEFYDQDGYHTDGYEY